MTKVERILAVLEGRPVDKLPKGEFYLEDELVRKLIQEKNSLTPSRIDLEEKDEAYERLGIDALVFMPEKGKEEPWQELATWRLKKDYFLFALIDGPFQGVGYGYEDFMEFLMDTRDEEKLQDLIQKAMNKSLELGKKALVAGAHGILIADDIAYNHSTYVSPTILRNNFFPHTKELMDNLNREALELRGEKVPFFFHSDGNILSVIKDLKGMGFQGIHSLEPVMDMAQIREEAGDMCLMGGYDLSWFFTGGISKAEELLQEALKGPYIFGSTSGILSGDLEPEPIIKVYDFVDEYFKTEK